MKLRWLTIIISILIATGCSSIKIQKRRYSKGFYISSKKNQQKLRVPKTAEIKSELKQVKVIVQNNEKPSYQKVIDAVKDTVRVYLKNGKVYQGVITEEKEKGFFLQISPQRTIYLSRYEVDEIVFVASEPENMPKEERGVNEETEEEYYSIDEARTQNQSFKERVRKKKDTTYDVPKQTHQAEVLLYVISALTVTGIGMFVAPLLFLIGLIKNRKGYLIAMSDPDQYDMDKVEFIQKLYRILAIVALSVLIAAILTVGIILIIFFII